MHLEDVLVPPAKITPEKWQLGSLVHSEIKEGGLVLIFCTDYRGAGISAGINADFTGVRQELYQLSKLDFTLPLCDLGDLISGKTIQDTHYILEEIVTTCLQKNALPIIIGGSNELAYPLYSALNAYRKNLQYTQVSNIVSLGDQGGDVDELNFLSRIFSSKHFTLKDYHHLAYQKHLNETDSVKLMKEVDFEVKRLADMMNTTEHTEPYFRRADLVTVNCDAVESFSEPFSVHPQVNGLNRREICAYMKEAGLSDRLLATGIFNYHPTQKNQLNQQLLAQMIWYLVEGINIQRSHPKERKYETFWVLVDDEQYAFQRDTFTGLWYFGADENPEKLMPCAPQDYEAAKRGRLNARFFKT